MKKLPRITSAKQALAESMALTSCLSRETLLSQRILIYQTELLEQSIRQVKSAKDKRWHKFLKKCLKMKLSVQQAQDLWKLT
jgi:hypothetical protein